jgi:hypothetical protein
MIFTPENHDKKPVQHSKSRRDTLLAPFLLALPVIFILIVLTKVIASDEYTPEPLEMEPIRLETRTSPIIPLDTVVIHADSSR